MPTVLLEDPKPEAPRDVALLVYGVIILLFIVCFSSSNCSLKHFREVLLATIPGLHILTKLIGFSLSLFSVKSSCVPLVETNHFLSSVS